MSIKPDLQNHFRERKEEITCNEIAKRVLLSDSNKSYLEHFLSHISSSVLEFTSLQPHKDLIDTEIATCLYDYNLQIPCTFACFRLFLAKLLLHLAVLLPFRCSQ